MEPEGSLPRSQEPATHPYPEPDRSSAYPPSQISNIYFNIILFSSELSVIPRTPGSSKWSSSYLNLSDINTHTRKTYAFLLSILNFISVSEKFPLRSVRKIRAFLSSFNKRFSWQKLISVSLSQANFAQTKTLGGIDWKRTSLKPSLQKLRIPKT